LAFFTVFHKVFRPETSILSTFSTGFSTLKQEKIRFLSAFSAFSTVFGFFSTWFLFYRQNPKHLQKTSFSAKNSLWQNTTKSIRIFASVTAKITFFLRAKKFHSSSSAAQALRKTSARLPSRYSKIPATAIIAPLSPQYLSSGR